MKGILCGLKCSCKGSILFQHRPIWSPRFGQWPHALWRQVLLPKISIFLTIHKFLHSLESTDGWNVKYSTVATDGFHTKSIREQQSLGRGSKKNGNDSTVSQSDYFPVSDTVALNWHIAHRAIQYFATPQQSFQMSHLLPKSKIVYLLRETTCWLNINSQHTSLCLGGESAKPVRSQAVTREGENSGAASKLK